MGKQWKQWETLFSWAPKSLQMVTTDMKLKDICSLEESYDQPNQYIKKKRHYIADKCLSNQSYGFSSSHVWMWELDYKETWAPRIWCFWTTVLEKILESPLDCKEIQPVNDAIQPPHPTPAPGVDDGQGSLACCSTWGHKESDTTEPLNWTELSLSPSA